MSTGKQPIDAAHAPAPVGAFSHAIRAGSLVFVSGQGPIDPSTDAVLGDSVGEQTAHTLRNLETILAAAGATLDHVVKVTAHLADLAAYAEYNDAYRRVMPRPYPARTTVQSGLNGILIEIDVIAALPS
jgi:reactive intermediate/imine deaminase